MAVWFPSTLVNHHSLHIISYTNRHCIHINFIAVAARGQKNSWRTCYIAVGFSFYWRTLKSSNGKHFCVQRRKSTIRDLFISKLSLWWNYSIMWGRLYVYMIVSLVACQIFLIEFVEARNNLGTFTVRNSVTQCCSLPILKSLKLWGWTFLVSLSPYLCRWLAKGMVPWCMTVWVVSCGCVI